MRRDHSLVVQKRFKAYVSMCSVASVLAWTRFFDCLLKRLPCYSKPSFDRRSHLRDVWRVDTWSHNHPDNMFSRLSGKCENELLESLGGVPRASLVPKWTRSSIQLNSAQLDSTSTSP